MVKRVMIVGGVALLLAILAAYVLRPETGAPAGAPELAQMADSLGAGLMEDLHRGHVPGRSGDIMTVPRPYRYIVGEWDLTTLGTATPWLATSHPNPWSYLQRVPYVFYGPGYVPEGLQVEREVDIASMAPTYASLVGLEGFEADGAPLTEITDVATGKPPKVVFTLVLDGGGWNVLQNYPDSWPALRALGRKGTSYTNATIGSAPSITGALHATFGTGSYPIRHGLPGNQLRQPSGRITDAWLEAADPHFLRIPTVSELWDEATGNKATVATVSYEGWHLGMIGHGAQREGGDKDVAALWEFETNEWWVNEDYYSLPDALRETDVARLESYEEALDERDGVPDGLWFDHSLEELQDPKVRPGTPAFVKFTGDAVMDVLSDEAVGTDDVTDFVWVEMKSPDYAGHAWNMEGPEVGDVVFEADNQLARFKRKLDDMVGEGNYVIAVSADHGQQPLPELRGGWRINSAELLRDIESRFGNVVVKTTTVDLFLDEDAMRREGVDPEEIARYLGSYTLGENIPDGAAGADLVPEGRLDELLFAGAFDDDYLRTLTADQIESFGASDYDEAVMTVPDGT
ncbi:MAG: alkaline phosphatase family protein [Actinobacteria bacterium]|nr:alkaline phosphatase family protein [Actinomycetota bacterium]